jgi:hypothetical protein
VAVGLTYHFCSLLYLFSPLSSFYSPFLLHWQLSESRRPPAVHRPPQPVTDLEVGQGRVGAGAPPAPPSLP